MGMLLESVQALFGGDVPDHPLGFGQIAARAALIYLVGIFAVRLGKSRILSRSSPLDVILGFVLGSLLSRGITGSASVSGTAVACGVLVFLHWAFTALACYSHRFGNLMKGHAKPLIEDGRVLWENLRTSHLSKNDLLEELRLNANIDDPSEVQAAYKERNGGIGVVKRKPEPRVIEISVEDGVKTVRIELAS
jgi:uncharacterized membrane protein YcaP (DUF421 family)